ncbi:unnamed protein product, partial [Rotaria magnacalcarata]
SIRSVRLAYIEKNTNILDRIYHACTSVFISRLWYLWTRSIDKKNLDLILSQVSNLDETSINTQSQTKRQYFITYQAHFSIEINAHCLVYIATLVSEGQLPNAALNIRLQNSQICEGTFRSARAISSVFPAGVNFTVAQFMNRINKLSTLQGIKSNTNQNNLRFHQHHKLHKTLINISNSSNATTLSKIAIENSVLQAYEYVAKLFSALKIKEILRRGRIMSIEESSRMIAQELDTFRSSDINVLNDSNRNFKIGSDNEQNDEIAIGSAECSDSDEKFELNDNLDVINNTSISANRGIRLCDDVKEELLHAYFKVKINNENKFMHKQAACWALEKDKSSFSATRLLRVQGR